MNHSRLVSRCATTPEPSRPAEHATPTRTARRSPPRWVACRRVAIRVGGFAGDSDIHGTHFDQARVDRHLQQLTPRHLRHELRCGLARRTAAAPWHRRSRRLAANGRLERSKQSHPDWRHEQRLHEPIHRHRWNRKPPNLDNPADNVHRTRLRTPAPTPRDSKGHAGCPGAARAATLRSRRGCQPRSPCSSCSATSTSNEACGARPQLQPVGGAPSRVGRVRVLRRERPPLQRDCDLAISRGGRYTIDNVVPACGSCNASKCNDEVTGWLRRGGSTTGPSCCVTSRSARRSNCSSVPNQQWSRMSENNGEAVNGRSTPARTGCAQLTGRADADNVQCERSGPRAARPRRRAICAARWSASSSGSAR